MPVLSGFHDRHRLRLRIVEEAQAGATARSFMAARSAHASAWITMRLCLPRAFVPQLPARHSRSRPASRSRSPRNEAEARIAGDPYAARSTPEGHRRRSATEPNGSPPACLPRESGRSRSHGASLHRGRSDPHPRRAARETAATRFVARFPCPLYYPLEAAGNAAMASTAITRSFLFSKCSDHAAIMPVPACDRAGRLRRRDHGIRLAGPPVTRQIQDVPDVGLLPS